MSNENSGYDKPHQSAWVALAILAVCCSGSLVLAYEMHGHSRAMREHTEVLREYMRTVQSPNDKPSGRSETN